VRPWRKVHAGLITSDKLAKVSDGAAFMYTLLLVAQDDAGCYPWTPAKIRALCVNRPWNGAKIASFVKELVEADLVEACDTVLHIVEGEAKNGKPNFSREPWYYDESAATWLQRSCKSAASPLQLSTADLPLVGEGVGEGVGDQVGDGGDSESPATGDRKKISEFRNSGFTVTEELLAWAQDNLKPALSVPELRNHTLEFSEYWTQQLTKRSLPGWERSWKSRMIAVSERKLAKAS